MYQSKTAYLEKALCWTGILVEPTNNEFPRLLVERSRSIAVRPYPPFPCPCAPSTAPSPSEPCCPDCKQSMTFCVSPTSVRP